MVLRLTTSERHGPEVQIDFVRCKVLCYRVALYPCQWHQRSLLDYSAGSCDLSSLPMIRASLSPPTMNVASRARFHLETKRGGGADQFFDVAQNWRRVRRKHSTDCLHIKAPIFKFCLSSTSDALNKQCRLPLVITVTAMLHAHYRSNCNPEWPVDLGRLPNKPRSYGLLSLWTVLLLCMT